MFNKTLITFSVFALLLPSSVEAQTSRPSPNTTKSGVRQEVRQKVEQRKEEVRLKVDATKRNNIRSTFARMVTKIEALTERLNLLADRIQARIDKIESEDSSIDTSQASTNLANAKVKIASAKTDLEKLKTSMEITLTADNPKESFITVRTTLDSINKNLKEAHRLMVSSIGDLKGLRVGQINNEKERQ